MKQTSVAFLVVLLLAGVFGHSQVVTDGSFVIPVVAKTPGDDGADWVSDLRISSVSDSDLGFLVFFLRANQANRAPRAGVGKSSDLNDPVSVLLGISGGETREIVDVVGTLFPEQGIGVKGFLYAVPDDIWTPGEKPLIAVSSRTYNRAEPERAYGQTVPGTKAEFVTGLGLAELPAIRDNASQRTNIGVVNFSAIELPIRVSLFDAGGDLVAVAERVVPQFSLGQWSVDDLGAAGLELGRATIGIDPDRMTWDPCLIEDPFADPAVAGRFLAYSSRIDRGTGDAEFEFAQVNWTAFENQCGYDPGDCWGW